LKEEKEDRADSQQPERGDKGCEKIKGKPGDDKEDETSKAKPLYEIDPWETEVKQKNHRRKNPQGSGQRDPSMEDHQ
jgi:hypothetical protein